MLDHIFLLPGLAAPSAPANQAPVNDLNGPGAGVDAAGTYYAAENFKSFLPDATVTDPDGNALAWLRLTCGGQWGADGPDELLRFDTWTVDSDTDYTADLTVAGTALTLSFTAATGILMVTRAGGGTFTPAVAQALERLLQYANGAEPPTNGERTFTWLANDGASTSAPTTLTVTVIPAPSSALNLGGPGGNFAGKFIIGATASPISNSATISGADPTSMTIALAGFVNGDDETVTIGGTSYPAATDDTGTATAGATNFDVVFTGGVFNVTKTGGGPMAKADVEAIIDGISTANAAWPFAVGPRTLAISLDGGPAKVATIAEYIAELPREYIDTTYSLPTGGTTYAIDESDNLQATIDAAVPGDVIILDAASTWTGPVYLPAQDGSGWIYIISSDLASLPEGVMVKPSDTQHMPTIKGQTNGNLALATVGAAKKYRMAGIQFLARDTGAQVGLIRTGHTTTSQNDFDRATDLADIPQDIIIDRCFFNSPSEIDVLQVGINWNGVRMSVIDSWTANCKSTSDAQAILIWNGPGPYKIVNNFLEATGENIMFGGNDAQIANLVPGDAEITRNYLFRRQHWKIPNLWDCKNLFETKNARRIQCEGNILENNWSDAQGGTAVLLTVRNQAGATPWATVEDITFKNNILRRVGSCIAVSGNDYNNDSQHSHRIHIDNCVMEDLKHAYGAAGHETGFFYLTNTDNTLPITRLSITNCLGVFDLADDTGGTLMIEIEFGDGATLIADYLDVHNNILEFGRAGPDSFASATHANLSGNLFIYNPVAPDYAEDIANHASNFPGNDKADEIADVLFTNLAGRDYSLQPSSPWYGDGLGPDFDAIDDALCDPFVVVQLDNLKSSCDVALEWTIGIDGATPLCPRAWIIYSHGPWLTNVQFTLAGILNGDDEIVTLGGVAFPQGTDKTDTSVTVNDTTFHIAFATATKLFTITNNDGSGKLGKYDANDLLMTLSWNNIAASPTEGERSLSVVANAGGVASVAAVARVNVVSAPSLPTVKINFRSTAGYVTDGPGETYSVASENYPVSRAGLTFGWVFAAVSANRSTSVDVRLAGMQTNQGNGSQYFILDLPPGTYDFRCAIGDMTQTFTGRGVEVRDGIGAVLLSETANTTAGSFMDAAGTVHTAANWPANNVAVPIVVPATSPQRITIHMAGSGINIAHISLTPPP